MDPIRRVLILGATGPTGRELVGQALAAGLAVSAFARRPDAVRDAHPAVSVTAGDVTTDLPALTGAMRGQHAVLSALGRGLSLNARGLMQRASEMLVAAMRASGTRRLIALSALGVGETIRDAPMVPRFMFRTMLRGIYADKAAGDAVVRGSGLDWTLIHPSMLSDGPATGRYRAGERLVLRGMPRARRADVAAFMLRCAADPASVQRSILVTGPDGRG